MNLSQRSTEVEIMDDLACRGPVVDQTLRELDFINKWLGGNAVTLSAVKRLLARAASPVVIADLGCGSGDMLARVARWAQANGIAMRGVGIDANPHIVAFARAHHPQLQLSFEAVNVFSDAFRKQTFDIIVATLFTHHFTHAELVALFQSLKTQARVAIVVNDIHRHPLAYYSIKWLTQAFSRSAMVKFDAPLSVRRSFTRSEWKHILAEAGLERYKLRWRWAFRWQLVIDTTAAMLPR
ncbi:MAG: methyltransferase domain-containing protein [Cyclobacteriaceae bacterium]|jgi:2-polyprenyl-3-methyl-5-hydroxy-6-metoxy-1,4-benzoquinol methylase|nr:methyltransferase domain-containing protein [Cyclobacteriaceae bacterium]